MLQCNTSFILSQRMLFIAYTRFFVLGYVIAMGSGRGLNWTGLGFKKVFANPSMLLNKLVPCSYLIDTFSVWSKPKTCLSQPVRVCLWFLICHLPAPAFICEHNKGIAIAIVNCVTLWCIVIIISDVN